MPTTTRRPPVRRPGLAAVATLTALAAFSVVGCSAGNPESAGDPGESPSDSSATPSGSSPSSSKRNAAPGTTPPGAELAFGDTATVVVTAGKERGLLDLTVESATQGSLDDLEGFDLDDPYKRRGNYYYVRVAVRNAGKKEFGGVAVPLWGLSGQGTLLRAVVFRSAFSTCPTEPLPEAFKPGDRFETCLVYLSPDHGSLEAVSYRPTADVQPIEWRGRVKTLPQEDGKGSDSKGSDTKGSDTEG